MKLLNCTIAVLLLQIPSFAARQATAKGAIEGQVLRVGTKMQLAGVPVWLLRPAYSDDGRRRMDPIGDENAETNDRGEYRLWGIDSGHYFVAAGGPSRKAGGNDVNSNPSNFGVTYYPSARILEDA